MKHFDTSQAIKPSSNNQVMKQANKQMNASLQEKQQDQLSFTLPSNLIKIAPSPTSTMSLNSLSKNTTYLMNQSYVNEFKLESSFDLEKELIEIDKIKKRHEMIKKKYSIGSSER